LSCLFGSYITLFLENEWPKPNCTFSIFSNETFDKKLLKCNLIHLTISKILLSEVTLISNYLLIWDARNLSWQPSVILSLLDGNFDSKKCVNTSDISDSFNFFNSFNANSVLLNWVNDSNSTYSLNVL